MQVKKIKSSELFVTAEFNDSAWIKAICDKRPEVWVTEDKIVAGHFGSFFGAMTLRSEDYLEGANPRPYVHDLYHLHELRHVETLEYDASWDWLRWSKNAIDSEFAASLHSECEVYYYLRDLREKTFDHPIWNDRFAHEYVIAVQDRDERDREANIRQLMAHIAKARERTMNKPKFDDFLELQVENYQKQNITWCSIWEQPVGYGPYAKWPAFAVVNEHMEKLVKGRVTDKEHMDWIGRMHPSIHLAMHHQSERSSNPHPYHVPFVLQAVEFEKVYKRSNEVYGNYKLSTKGARDGNYPVLEEGE